MSDFGVTVFGVHGYGFGVQGSWLRFRALCLVLWIWFGFVSLIVV